MPIQRTVVGHVGAGTSELTGLVSAATDHVWMAAPFLALAFIWLACVVYLDLAQRWRLHRQGATMHGLRATLIALEAEAALAAPDTKQALADLLARHGLEVPQA